MRKRIGCFLMAVLFCCVFLFSGYNVKASTDTDIVITGFQANKDNIYVNQEFDLDISYKDNSGKNISEKDLYIIIDPNCSFYGLVKNVFPADTMEKTKLKLVYKGTGKELKLTFKAKVGESGEVIESTQSIFLNAYPMDQGGSSTPPDRDPKKYMPRLGITGDVKIPVGRAGQNMSITLPVKNNSSYAAKDVTITPEFSSDKASLPIALDKLNLVQNVGEIPGNETKEVVLSFYVNSNAVAGIYPIKINYHFSNSYSDSFDSSETIYIKIENNNLPARLIVEGVKVTPEVIVPGGTAKVAVTIKNSGDVRANDIKVSLKGLKKEGFTVLDSTDSRYIAGMNGGKSSVIEYNLSASSSLLSGGHDLVVKLDYKDSANNAVAEESQIFLPVRGEETGKASLTIEGINAPHEALNVNTDFQIGFALVNNGEGKASNIKVSVTSDKEIIAKTLNTVAIPALDKGQSQNLNFVFSATSEAVSKSYPIAINIEYDEVQGDKTVKQTATQYVGVYVENEKSGENKSVPKLIVSQYKFEPTDIKAGDTVDLSLSFLNTSRTSGIHNIKVQLSSDDGTFTPSDSSNTFFIESIASNGSVDRNIKLFVKPDAAQKAYGLTLNFEYEDSKGTAVTAKELISIPVQQAPRLVIGEVSLLSEAFAGQPVPVNVEFYNMGKSTLSNLMIKAEGNFDVQSSSSFYGNMEPGRSDFYDCMITAKEAGPLEGHIIFSFEDSNGKAVEIKKEIKANAVQMQMQPMSPEEMGRIALGNKEKKGVSPFVWGGAAAGVIVLIIAFIAIRKRRLAKKGAMMDESI